MKNLNLSGMLSLQNYAFPKTDLYYYYKMILGITLFLLLSTAISAQERFQLDNDAKRSYSTSMSKIQSFMMNEIFYDFSDGSLPDEFVPYIDGTAFGRNTSSNAWYVEQSDNTYQSGYSLRSGQISHNENTNTGFEVSIGPEGATLSFKYRISSENSNDEFVVVLDNSTIIFIDSGEISWTDSPELDLPEGTYFIDFWYTKNASVNTGLDAVFVDNISVLPKESSTEPDPQFVINSIVPEAAIPGSEVTIFGAGFSTTASQNTVQFGSQSAVVNSASENQLNVTVPELDPGSVTVDVSTSAGTVQWVDKFSVLQGITPQFNSDDVLNISIASPLDVITADLNKDGNSDIITASYGGHMITWYPGNGNGTYGSENVISSNITNATAVAAGDIDNDGDMDVVSGSYSNDHVTVHFNDGSNSFTSTVVSLTADGIWDVKLADLNNDGLLDIINAEYSSGQVSWHKNLGNGEFTEEITLSSSDSNLRSVYAADLNNDGWLDIITGSYNNNVSWLRNNGDDTFSSRIVISSESSVSSVFGVDIDGDGDQDIISGSNGNQRINFHRNEGNESFSNFIIASSVGTVEDVETGDIDGDGDQDIVFVSYTGNLGTLMNDGNGNFSNLSYVSQSLSNPYSTTLADNNNDGDLDIISAVYGSSQVAVHTNSGFPPAEPIDLAITKTYPEAASPWTEVILHGKGFSTTASQNTVTFGGTQANIISASTNKLVITVPEAEPGIHNISITNSLGSADFAGKFTILNQKELYFKPKASDLEETRRGENAMADVDKDGDLDLLITGTNAAGQYFTRLYYNNGEGVFSDSGVSLEGMQYSSAAFGDTDNDGDVDLLISGVSSTYGHTSILYLNDGEGGFTESDANILGGSYSDNALADLNGDGYLDIVVIGNSTSGKIAQIYMNLGNGLFEPGETLIGVLYGKLDIADANNDGHLDILYSGYNVSNVPATYLYLNDGSASFTNSGASLEGIYHSSTEFSDVDSDGDMDIFISGLNSSSQRVSRLYINSSGTYTDSGVSFESVYYSSSAFGDVDGDGDQDLMLSGINNSSVRISKLYLNNGSGNFTEATPSFEGVYEGDITLGDINGDGDLDVLISGYNSANLAVTRLYENGSPPFVITKLETESGAPGSQLTLHGRGFNPDDNSNTVAFGTEQAVINSADSNRITVTIPEAAAGNYPLSVSNDNGTAEYAGTFTILNQKRAYFTESETVLEGVYHSASDFADIDGDGDLDLLVMGYNGSAKMQVMKNDGNGNYTSTEQSFSGGYYSSVNFADFDGDDDLDLLFTGYTSSGRNSKIYLNDGSGSFSDSGVSLDPLYQSSSDVADVDNDGDIDIFISGNNNSNIRVSKLYLNDGIGGFTEDTGQAFTGVMNSSTSFADVDNDGDMDLLITGYSSSNTPVAELYENDGDGNFTNTSIATIDPVRNSTSNFNDIDSDGDLDLFITGVNSSGVGISKLYLNDGSGAFSDSGEIFDGIQSGAVSINDVDGDGDNDIMLSGSASVRITKLYLNNGSGQFADSELAFTGSQYGSISMGDIDEDGDLDVLLSGYSPTNEIFTVLYDNIIPPGPSNLKVQVADGSIELNWDPSPLTDIGGHNIYRSDSSFNEIGQAVKLNTELITTTTFTDINLTENTKYYYRVTAVDSLTTEESVFSNEAIANYKLKTIYASSHAAQVAGGNITLYGTNLSTNIGDYSVVIGGSSAQVLSATESSVVIQVPDITPGNHTFEIDLSGIELPYHQLFTVLEDVPDESGFFQEAVLLTNQASSVKKISVSDLNGDGNFDVLTPLFDSGITSWMAGNGDGTFEALSAITDTTKGATDALAADLDGDGDMDIITASYENDMIAWFRNNGSGSYSLQAILSETSDGANSVQVADIDLDGDLDIVAASELDNTLSWFENEGDAHFSVENIISASAGSLKNIKVADVNNDGYMDIISASDLNDLVGLYLNNTNGTFAGVTIISNTVDGVQNVLTGDLNADGETDIISVSENDGGISWFSNNADGTFSTKISIGSLSGAFDVQLGDINGDGLQDIIASSGEIIAWFRNNGDETFSGADTIAAEQAGKSYLSLVDVDDNGTLDVIAANTVTGEIQMFKNVDMPPLAPTDLAIAGGIGKAHLSWAPNAEPDILGYDILRKSATEEEFSSVLTNLVVDTTYTDTGLQNGRLYSYKVVAVDSTLNRVPSTAIEITAISTQISRFEPSSGTPGTLVKIHGVGFSDNESDNSVLFGNTSATINNATENYIVVEVPSGINGLADITVNSEDVAYQSPQPFLVLRSNEGTFSTALTATGFSGNGNIAAADVDADGDMDLMVTRPASNGLTLYYSASRNPYSSLTNFNYSGVSVKKVQPINVAGEHFPDFVFISQLDNQFRVMKNTGNGATNTSLFNVTTVSVSHDNPEDIQPVDMDNDGFTDVVIASSGDNKISWYKNKSLEGEVIFNEETVVSGTANGVISIAAGDFNHDNLTDIVSANAFSHEVVLYQNTGTGFTSTVVQNTTDPKKVVVSDVDSDGDLDIVTASAGNHAINLLVNDGTGDFSNSIEISSDVSAASDVSVDDINGDGLQDIIATSQGSGTISLFLNEGSNNFQDAVIISDDISAAVKGMAYDMNGDGQLDIVARSSDSGVLSVFRNIRVQGLFIEDFIAGENHIMLPNDDIEIVFESNVTEIEDFESLFTNAITIADEHGEEFAFSTALSGNSLILAQESFFSNQNFNLTISSDVIAEASLGEFFIDLNNNDIRDLDEDIYESPAFRTTYAADFTRDELVDFDDLVLFSDGWRSNDYTYETAPLINSNSGFPVVRTEGNSDYNIDDLINFIRFWNLSQQENSAKEATASVKDDGLSELTSKRSKSPEQTANKKAAKAEVSLSDTLQFISYEKIIKNVEYSSAEQYPELTYTFSLSVKDSVKALSLQLDFDEELLQLTAIKNLGLFNDEQKSNTIFISQIDSARGKAVMDIATMGTPSSLNEQKIVEVTFRALKDKDAEVTITADLRTQGKPAFLQRAKQVVAVENELPQSFALSHNYPNPFNPTTNIHYELAEQSVVSMDVYDILGRKVETLISQHSMKAGYYKATWNATRYASGMYIYVLNVKTDSGKKHTFTKKMMLIK